MKKKSMKRRTKFTICAIANIIWYTIAVLIINAMGNEVQSELTVAWFAAWTAELAMLFGIKIKGRNDDDGN